MWLGLGLLPQAASGSVGFGIELQGLGFNWLWMSWFGLLRDRVRVGLEALDLATLEGRVLARPDPHLRATLHAERHSTEVV